MNDASGKKNQFDVRTLSDAAYCARNVLMVVFNFKRAGYGKRVLPMIVLALWMPTVTFVIWSEKPQPQGSGIALAIGLSVAAFALNAVVHSLIKWRKPAFISVDLSQGTFEVALGLKVSAGQISDMKAVRKLWYSANYGKFGPTEVVLEVAGQRPILLPSPWTNPTIDFFTRFLEITRAGQMSEKELADALTAQWPGALDSICFVGPQTGKS